MISGERLHGFLIYFSAVSAEEGKPLKNSLKTAQTPLSELRYPPAGNRKGAEKPSIQSFVGQEGGALLLDRAPAKRERHGQGAAGPLAP